MSIEVICAIIGAVAAVIGGVWALLAFVFKLGKTSDHLEYFEKSTGDSFKGIDKKFDSIDKKFEGMDTRMGKMESSIDDHTLALEKLFTFLGQKYPRHATLFLQKHSPRTLTDLGKQIFEEVNGETFLNTNKDILFEYIDAEEPKTRLDVEKYSFMALVNLSTDDTFNGLKDYVYERPAIDMGNGRQYELSITDICLILSIPLRDMYISERDVR